MLKQARSSRPKLDSISKSILVGSYEQNPYPNKKTIERLANETSLTDRRSILLV